MPEAWPITYDQMRPWYAEAEKLLGVRGQPDPLRPEAAEVGLPPAPPFSPTISRWSTISRVVDCIPITCRWPAITPTGVPPVRPTCARSRAKTTPAAMVCCRPLPSTAPTCWTECRVLRLEADRTQVRQVIAQHRSDTLTLQAKVVVLAAGALATPLLLLNSRSGDWPRGLANGSDWVGRNLMRHLLDWIEVWPEPGCKITDENKEIGLNDFYFYEGQKYGTVQSASAMATLASMDMLTNHPGWQPKMLRLMSPAVRPIYDRFFNGGLVLVAIMEDLPYLDNRVQPSDRPGADGRQRLRLQYRLHPNEIERRKVFLRQVKEALKPFRTLTLRTGANNSTLGHVCGTCRFGTDPKNQRARPTKPRARSRQPLRGGRLVLSVQRRFESQFDGRGQRAAGGRAHQPGALRRLTATGRRSANTPQASEILHKIRGGRDAFGGLVHPSGDLTGAGEVLRSEDGTQVCDQRFLGGGRKAPSSAHFQPFHGCSPDDLNVCHPQDQRGDSGAQARGRGARTTVVHDRAAGRKDRRVIHRAHHLDVLEVGDVAEVARGGANQRPLA